MGASLNSKKVVVWIRKAFRKP